MSQNTEPPTREWFWYGGRRDRYNDYGYGGNYQRADDAAVDEHGIYDDENPAPTALQLRHWQIGEPSGALDFEATLTPPVRVVALFLPRTRSQHPAPRRAGRVGHRWERARQGLRGGGRRVRFVGGGFDGDGFVGGGFDGGGFYGGGFGGLGGGGGGGRGCDG